MLQPQFVTPYTDCMSIASVSPYVRTIGAREFKERCLQILREINETGETVVVTRHKVPIARISAFQHERPVSIFGRCAGELRILGDITASVFDPESFDMQARPERILDPEGYDRNTTGGPR